LKNFRIFENKVKRLKGMAKILQTADFIVIKERIIARTPFEIF